MTKNSEPINPFPQPQPTPTPQPTPPKPDPLRKPPGGPLPSKDYPKPEPFPSRDYPLPEHVEPDEPWPR